MILNKKLRVRLTHVKRVVGRDAGKGISMKFTANMCVYYYNIDDRYHINSKRFLCPELFSKEQFHDLKEIILEAEFGKTFSEKPLARNTEGGYEVMIGGDFKFEVCQVAADPSSLQGIAIKERFPEGWLKRVLRDLLIPKDDITISSWEEFVKGLKLLGELENNEE